MDDEKKALTWQEFVDSGFDGRDYQFPDFEGTYEATIACKRWNKSRNLLVYLDHILCPPILPFLSNNERIYKIRQSDIFQQFSFGKCQKI